MSKFSLALGRTITAVHKVFETDHAIQTWVVVINSSDEYSSDRTSNHKLSVLLGELRTGWVSNLLHNEDRSEEAGVIAEAITVVVRGADPSTLTRLDFSYTLTRQILERGVRPLNRTSRAVDPECPWEEPLIDETADPQALSDADTERLDNLMLHIMSGRRPKNEVVDPPTVLSIKNAWLGAIKFVEQKEGKAAAQPMSLSVKIKIASDLGLDVKTVEAGMKRLKRACSTAEANASKDEIESWLLD